MSDCNSACIKYESYNSYVDMHCLATWFHCHCTTQCLILQKLYQMDVGYVNAVMIVTLALHVKNDRYDVLLIAQPSGE